MAHIMDVCYNFILIFFTPITRKGASVLWHLSLRLMNIFNKTEAPTFREQALLLSLFFRPFN